MKRIASMTPSEKEKHWTEIIEEARRYPAGVAAYCRDKGVNKNTYYVWFNRLRAKHPEWGVDLVHNPAHKLNRAKAKHAGRSTQVEPKATRRKFTAKQKTRILQETDAAAPGAVAAILRREGIYSSTLQKWRVQREEGSLAEKKRGRKRDSDAARVKELEQEVAKLKWKLKHKDALLDLQKKIAQILETTDNEK